MDMTFMFSVQLYLRAAGQRGPEAALQPGALGVLEPAPRVVQGRILPTRFPGAPAVPGCRDAPEAPDETGRRISFPDVGAKLFDNLPGIWKTCSLDLQLQEGLEDPKPRVDLRAPPVLVDPGGPARPPPRLQRSVLGGPAAPGGRRDLDPLSVPGTPAGAER
ncbi:hypothetical protein EYF80_052602 [Liparis tanakae]|uniref:Uncharacterized protein n=1 Tax=Liparis tanakae TaxID=230148 RepID=A0A4Z2F7M0_9TELE|nr:hypothetical protein EYF80_052602 [Liparis tanakae]